MKPPERHAPFFELWDALGAADACAICVLRERRARLFMEHLFEEQVNDPGLRAHWHESLGFGPEGERLAEAIHDCLGASILYEALAHDVARRLEQNPPTLRPRRDCPLETSARDVERRFLDLAAAHYAEPDFQARHAAGFGFCLAHLDGLLQRLRDRGLRERLCAMERAKVVQLEHELHDYVARSGRPGERPTAAEAEAWRRALRKFRRATGEA